MVRALAFGLVLALLAGACSDDGPAPTTVPASSAPVTTAGQAAAPTSTLADTPIEVAPFAPLAGVELDTAADAAVPFLVEAFGGPDSDTGLVEGCPLDGEGTNERFVSWGGLTAQFRVDADGTPRLVAWTYDVAVGPPPRPVRLPGGAVMGGSLAAAAAALGAPVVFDEVFEADVVAVEGLAVWGFPEIALVGVPFVPTCE